MLCSSAEGTPELVEAMNTAVPGTRVELPCALLAKISIGSALSVIDWRISSRPRDQVVSKVKITKPMRSGTHPPCGTLIRLAPK